MRALLALLLAAGALRSLALPHGVSASYPVGWQASKTQDGDTVLEKGATRVSVSRSPFKFDDAVQLVRNHFEHEGGHLQDEHEAKVGDRMGTMLTGEQDANPGLYLVEYLVNDGAEDVLDIAVESPSGWTPAIAREVDGILASVRWK